MAYLWAVAVRQEVAILMRWVSYLEGRDSQPQGVTLFSVSLADRLRPMSFGSRARLTKWTALGLLGRPADHLDSPWGFGPAWTALVLPFSEVVLCLL